MPRDDDEVIVPVAPIVAVAARGVGVCPPNGPHESFYLFASPALGHVAFRHVDTFGRKRDKPPGVAIQSPIAGRPPSPGAHRADIGAAETDSAPASRAGSATAAVTLWLYAVGIVGSSILATRSERSASTLSATSASAFERHREVPLQRFHAVAKLAQRRCFGHTIGFEEAADRHASPPSSSNCAIHTRSRSFDTAPLSSAHARFTRARPALTVGDRVGVGLRCWALPATRRRTALFQHSAHRLVRREPFARFSQRRGTSGMPSRDPAIGDRRRLRDHVSPQCVVSFCVVRTAL